MTFNHLKIERKKWGKDEGKLVAEISLSSDKATTTLILPDQVGEQILRMAKSAIIDSVEKTANDFIFEITTSIPETLNLQNTP